ncbi:MAG: MBL fold metallo-hydrolase [Clostridia bacterium]|nr:MBL fold metallo-hydrolase [Clostridia bacterium]
MKNAKAKKIATWIIVPLMISFFVLDIITVIIGNIYAKRYSFTPESFTCEFGDDRIHFLNTANSDCIMLESNGHFALIDSGEGNHNPRRKEAYQGFEERVIAYIKKTVSKTGGKYELDFILGTHYHYDHVGSFHSIITDSEIKIDRAYFKKYNPEMDKEMEVYDWGLLESYNQIVKDLESKQIELIQDIPESFKFGDFNLEFFNRGYYEDLKGRGDNSESIGIKVTKGEKTALLAADITGPSGLEDKLGKEIGHCDLLKAGHHGYYGSSSRSFLKCITPEVIIVPNMQGKVYPNVKWNFTMYAKAPFYATYEHNGIIATFTDDNRIVLTDNLH